MISLEEFEALIRNNPIPMPTEAFLNRCVPEGLRANRDRKEHLLIRLRKFAVGCRTIGFLGQRLAECIDASGVDWKDCKCFGIARDTLDSLSRESIGFARQLNFPEDEIRTLARFEAIYDADADCFLLARGDDDFDYDIWLDEIRQKITDRRASGSAEVNRKLDECDSLVNSEFDR
jgi:hypothetical protein